MSSYNKIDAEAWEEKIRFFKSNFSQCKLCPRECGAQRESGVPGVCHAGKDLRIASYNIHNGEEPPISGRNGSGAVFFSGCTMKCVFCQNFPISQFNNGRNYSINELSEIFLELEKRGAHNINLVSPTPYLFHIVKALRIASDNGLEIPVVYNSGGYEKVSIIRELNNIVDIYMPDFKYSDADLAKRFSGVVNYPKIAFEAISEMYRQTGSLMIDKDGIAVRGIIIRHLILPGHILNSKNILKKIGRSKLKDAYLSLMSQFFPAYNSTTDEYLSRKLVPEEYEDVRSYAISEKLEKGWFQDI